MLNGIDWIVASADYMVARRPDVYTKTKAIDQLTEQMNTLKDTYGDLSPAVLISGGFIMIRVVEDEGHEGFILAELVSGFDTFYPEETSMVYRGNVEGVELPHISDTNPLDTPEDM